jgi:hypothetical protein
VPGPADTSEPADVERTVGAGPPGGRPRPTTRVARDAGRPGRSARSVLELKVDAEVSDLLTRIVAQEQVAGAAQSDLEEHFGWPSWSMDTGLTPAQEKFVEHWSPQRVLDESRLLRQLVMVLQRWSSTRGDDASLDEALTILRDLQPQ